VNAGLTLGLINNLTHAEVEGDRALARRYTSSLTFAPGVRVLVGFDHPVDRHAVIPWPKSWVDNP